MTRVLVLAAIHLEARGLARRLGLPPARSAAWPSFRGGVLELVCVGLGAADLEARMAACGSLGVIVAAGTCGALSPGLQAGSLVVPEVVIHPDGRRLATTPLSGLSRRGTLLTSSAVAETAGAKARLRVETGALAVDMESAIIVAWARARGLGATVVRGVSDSATRGVPADLAAIVGTSGDVSRARAVRAMLARPRALRDATILRRGTEAALDAVAAALATVARNA